VQPALAGNLLEYLSQIPDPRGRQGRRFPLSALLATVICAVLTGAQGFEAIADWMHAQQRQVWWRLGFSRRPPTANAFRYLLINLLPEQLEQAISRWVAQVLGEPAAARLTPVALDGKSLCGVLVGHERTMHLLALLDQESGGVLRQMLVESDTNEIGAAPALLSQVPLASRDRRRAVVSAAAQSTNYRQWRPFSAGSQGPSAGIEGGAGGGISARFFPRRVKPNASGRSTRPNRATNGMGGANTAG